MTTAEMLERLDNDFRLLWNALSGSPALREVVNGVPYGARPDEIAVAIDRIRNVHERETERVREDVVVGAAVRALLVAVSK